MLLVFLAFYHEATLQLCWNLYVVVAIDAEYVLNHVAGTLHINPVCRHFDVESVAVLGGDGHLQRLADVLYCLMFQILTYEVVHIVVFKAHLNILYRFRINVTNLHCHLSASQLLAKYCSLLKGIDGGIRVNATLESERRVGTQSMTAGALAYPCGMEISTLQHHVASGLIGAATLATKNSCYTHGFLGIADTEVVCAEGMFNTVECHELSAFRLGAHHNLVALHHVSVKTVHWLTVSHHHIVSDIHYIINRS